MIDLIELFSEKYGKPIKITGLRPGEKMLESLISETQAMRLVKTELGYMHIKPSYKNIVVTNDVKNYNSMLNPLNKEELKLFMDHLSLI
jgi:FlaA1/EpsC-like NDP-sugar epimerase